MTVDFRNIDINEELSQAETTDMMTASSLVDRVERRRNTLDNGIGLPWAKLDGLVLLRPGEVSLFGGYSGHMKSTITSQIGMSAMRQGLRVGVASLELMAEDVIEQYAEMGAARERPPIPWVRRFASWCADKLYIYDRVDAIKPDEAVQMVIAFAKFMGCKLIILDALMMMGVCDDLERERDFTQTLAAVAKRFQIHVMLVHHVRKPQTPQGEAVIPGKYDFIGSSHLANVASSIFICWHDKKKAAKARLIEQGVRVEDFDDNKPDLVFKVAKQRYAKFEGAIGLWQNGACRAFCNTSQRKLAPLELGAV